MNNELSDIEEPIGEESVTAEVSSEPELAAALPDSEEVTEFPTPTSTELASRAEMLFAGHYLNLAGILLVLTGLVSYLKSSGASSGLLESLLGGALGLVLLVAGEYLFRKGHHQYSHPVLLGGFCLLFFAACSAHFRHGLMSQTALFAMLLPVVIASNASVFRYNSKLIGNVILIVYFFSPLFVTFTFNNFSTIFLYLLAINLGSTAVAFYKKWDFQLLMASLGSYALFFTHFGSDSPMNSLLLLFVIYGLSLIANNLLYFFRPESSDYNLVLSFINPTVFAALSAVTIMALPNWARVAAYCGLAVIHGVIALIADDRRAENPNFLPLATSSLALTLLFSCAAISFITYFSDSTTYFGLVTLLWFVFSLLLAWSGFKLVRHAMVLSRFSYFGILLAAAQVAYVLPSMTGSEPLRMAALALYLGYFAILMKHRKNLTTEQRTVLNVTGILGAPLFAHTILSILPPSITLVALALLVAASLRLPLSAEELPRFRFIPHLFAGTVTWLSFVGSPLPILVPLAALIIGFATERAIKQNYQVESLWVWSAVLLLRTAGFTAEYSVPGLVIALAVYQLLLTGIRAKIRDTEDLQKMSAIGSLVLVAAAYLIEGVPVSVLLLALIVLASSIIVAQKSDLEMSSGELVLQGLLLAKVAAVAYVPYPVPCLVIAGIAGVLFTRLGLPQAAFTAHGLVTLGVFCLPFQMSTTTALIGLILVCGTFFVSYFQSGLAHTHPDKLTYSLAGMGTLCYLKFSMALQIGPVSTLAWALLATWWMAHSAKHGLIKDWIHLKQGLFDYSRVLFFLAFVKSVLLDANFINDLNILHYPSSFLVSLCFLTSAHLFIGKREARNCFVILGLLSCCFQVTFLVHGWWGDRLIFQPVLSGFWSLVGFGITALGVAATIKIYRMFGLATLVGNTAKILLVDIHVLDSYSQVNTYLILGSLLMMTSFLYQRQKERLSGFQPVKAKPAAVSL